MRAQRLDPLVVRPGVAEQRLDRERAGQVRGPDQHTRVDDREREQRLHRLGAVDQRKPFLGRQFERLHPVLGQHLGGWPARRRVPRATQPPLPDQRLRQVGELGQVPRRTHRTLSGHDRQQIAVEHFDQPRRQIRPDTGVPRRQRSGPQKKQSANGGIVERLTHAGGVRADNGALQAGEVAGAHPGVRERPEAGVDAVDGRVALDGCGDHGPARLHDGRHAVGQFGGRGTTCDVHHVFDRESVAVDDHFSHEGQPAISRPVPAPPLPCLAREQSDSSRDQPNVAASPSAPAGVTRTARRRAPRSIQPRPSNRAVMAAPSAPFRCGFRSVQSRQAPAKRRLVRSNAPISRPND